MVIILLGAALMVTALVAWFYVLELNDRRHTIFLIFVGVFFVEVLTMPEAASVPVGLFRPTVLGQDFRPPDLIIFAALAARVLGGRWGRIGPTGLAWSPFIAFYATGTFIGLALVDLPFAQVLFQGKLLLYIVGAAVIFSGADVRRLADDVGRFGVFVAPLVPIAFITSASGSGLALNTPLQRFPELGRFSNDTVTVLVVLGGMVIACELVRKPPRLSAVIGGCVLLLAPLTGTQRASYLSLVAVVGVLVLLLAGNVWRRRSVVSVSQVILVLATVASVSLVGFALGGGASLVDDAFGGQGKSESAEARVRLYDRSVALISERPILGSGVGIQVESTRVNTGEELVTVAHNVVLDMWLRVGLVGLVFFFVALTATVLVGWGVWRNSTDDAAAAIGVAAVILIAGWFAKALVEPALDKFRLSLILGAGVGLAAAAWRAVEKQRRSDPFDQQTDPVEALQAGRSTSMLSSVADRS